MNQQFASVWYATPEKVESTTKCIAFSDRGSLELWPDQLIQYRGKRFSVSMQNVFRVSLTSQRIPWVTYAIVNLAAAACYAVPLFVVMFLGVSNVGVPAAILIGAISILVASNLLGMLIAANTKWVMVEYQDEFDQSRTAYFADGSLLGWGGILGGTSALYRAIEQCGHVDG
jgi:hypothetical protein